MAVPGQPCNDDLQCQSGLCDDTTNTCSAILDCSSFTSNENCCSGGVVTLLSGKVCVVSTDCTLVTNTFVSGSTLCVEAGVRLMRSAAPMSFQSGSTIRFYGRPGAPIVVTPTGASNGGMLISTSLAHIQHTRIENAATAFSLAATSTSSSVLRNLASFCTTTGLRVTANPVAGSSNRVTRFHSHRTSIGVSLYGFGSGGVLQSPFERLSVSVITSVGLRVEPAMTTAPIWPLSHVQLLVPRLASSDAIQWYTATAPATTWTDVTVGQLTFSQAGNFVVDEIHGPGSDLSLLEFDGFVRQSGSFPTNGGFDSTLGAPPTLTGTVVDPALASDPALQYYPWVQALSGTGSTGS
ncbi:MAG: hypothetical protein MHM6MM_007575 [Cercozoa sp. M6MM]